MCLCLQLLGTVYEMKHAEFEMEAGWPARDLLTFAFFVSQNVLVENLLNLLKMFKYLFYQEKLHLFESVMTSLCLCS